MTADHTPRCTCAEDGHARRCSVHTQADFDAAELTREGTADHTPERLDPEFRGLWQAYCDEKEARADVEARLAEVEALAGRLDGAGDPERTGG